MSSTSEGAVLAEIRISFDRQDGTRENSTVALCEVTPDRPVGDQIAEALREIADEFERPTTSKEN